MAANIFHNRPNPNGIYSTQSQRILPLDDRWLHEMTSQPWPNHPNPQVINPETTLKSLIGEYVFVTLFKACAESLNSENAARVIAMQRAEKNIKELL
ncbi:F0F1 ATP synthase subunit gamma [Pontibacter sp. MBLB2868]|uniref:F0F1 ATP synthase subunit gamma n=1 Tax=Pontibacter sp. MBLB2868 TaxID=3451555 RepID=UPI003F757050